MGVRVGRVTVGGMEERGRICQLVIGGAAIMLLFLVALAKWGLHGIQLDGGLVAIVAWLVSALIPSRTTERPALIYAVSAVFLGWGLPWRHMAQHGRAVWFEAVAVLLVVIAALVPLIIRYEAKRQGLR